MKAFLKKHFIIIAVVGFVLISFLCAFTGNKVATTYYTEKDVIMALPWSLEPTSDYIAIYYGDVPGQFEVLSEDDSQIIDAKGKILKEVGPDESLGEGLYLYSDGDLYGVKDEQREIVIKAKYSWIEPFRDGYTIVCDTNKHDIIIDRSGRIVFYEKRAQSISHIDQTYYLIQATEPFVVNAATGEEIQLPVAASEIYSDGMGGYIGLRKSGGQFFLTKEFKLTSDKQLYKTLGPLSEGLRFAGKFDGVTLDNVSDDFDEDLAKASYSYMNADGQAVIKLPYEDNVDGGIFSEGKALVLSSRNNELVCIDKMGSKLFTLKTDYSDDYFYVDVPCFSQGYAPVSLNGSTYGFIDKKGEFAVAPLFKSAKKITNGYSIVTYRNTHGILDLKEGI